MTRTVIFLLCLFLLKQTQAQNVGIGTAVPNHPLTVAADADSKGIAQKNGAVEIGFWTSPGLAFLQTWTPHDLNFATNNGTAKLTLANSTGYFGVGTSLPAAQLDVNGTFRLRGNGAASGNVLVSDANGNAAWQPLGSAGGWSLTGNGGTNPAQNFLGTTDNQPLVFRQNNVYAGKFQYALRNYFIGNYSGLNTVAPHNIAIGDSALLTNVSGYSNIAIGSGALQGGSKYRYNVAIGDSTLFWNGVGDDGGGPYGIQNTAVGALALYKNYSGFSNTAVGFQAGTNMQLGSRNTAMGTYAMHFSSSSEAYENVAVGLYALDSVLRGKNTSVGAYSLQRTWDGDENTAIGWRAMWANKSGDSNTAVGTKALYGNISGLNNTALGASALSENRTGHSNVAIGIRALAFSKDRSNLVAVGDSALYYNGTDTPLPISAANNTAVGSKALFSNSRGGFNTALGAEAGYGLNLGYYNTAVGALAMRNANGLVARNNTGIGVQALYQTQGEENVAIGNNTLQSNTSGSKNTAIGLSAMNSNDDGIGNTSLGAYSLTSNLSGDYNTALGIQALALNKTGGANVAIGSEALNSNRGGSSNVAVGVNALFLGSDRSYLVAVGDSALYNNGLGVTSSSQGTLNTALGSKALRTNTLGSGNTAVGLQALSVNATGNRNTALGVFSGNLSANNTFCTFLGAYSNNATTTAYSNSTAIGDGSVISASNQVRVGDAGVTSIGGQVGWTTLSDGRFKKDLAFNVPGLSFISELRPLTYRLKTDELNRLSHGTGKDYRDASDMVLSGFVAQDVETAAKKIGYAFSGVDKPASAEGFYGLRYADFVVPLVRAVQELSSANDALQQKLDKQQQTIEALERRLSAIEKK